jgi:putative transposase
MARPLRLHVPGAIYHVTLRGNHRQDIFFTPADRARLSSLITEVFDRFSARLHAYCYMTNHVHAVIQVSEEPLGRLMMRIAGQYARATQWRLETTGHLFEKRYHPTLVDADAYLQELLRYVHLNPVRAGLAPSPDAYPWTSHHAYAGTREEPWVTTEFALSLFAQELSKARRAYLRFVAEAVGKTLRSPFEDRNFSDPRILGSDDFARRMLGDGWTPRSKKTLDDLIAEAGARFNLSLPLLSSVCRRADLVEARAWIANEAVTHRIASISEVARKLDRDESSLRRLLDKRYGRG